MIVYRAMCEEEAVPTLKAGTPQFWRRFKWFATNLDFIRNRVCDGEFNNSKFKENPYARVFEFEIKNIDKVDYISKNEVQLDRRKANSAVIKLIREIVL